MANYDDPRLNTAIAYTNAGRLADARAALGELDAESLSPFERGKAEEIHEIGLRRALGATNRADPKTM